MSWQWGEKDGRLYLVDTKGVRILAGDRRQGIMVHGPAKDLIASAPDLAAKLAEAERERDDARKAARAYETEANAAITEAAALRAERERLNQDLATSRIYASEKEQELANASRKADEWCARWRKEQERESRLREALDELWRALPEGAIVSTESATLARAALPPAAEVMRRHGFPEPSPEAQAAELLADSAAEAPAGELEKFAFPKCPRCDRPMLPSKTGGWSCITACAPAPTPAESLTDAIRSLPGELRKEFKQIDDEARARRAGGVPGRFVDNMTVPDPPGLLDTPAPIPAEATGETVRGTYWDVALERPVAFEHHRVSVPPPGAVCRCHASDVDSEHCCPVHGRKG